MDRKREQLRGTFDQSAEVYDRVRPGYPDALIDDVIRLSGIPHDGRILEIGCGTGKATEPFALRGYRIDCLEIGRYLAAVAAAKFRGLPNVRVIVSSFEDWQAQDRGYDLVLAATSLHWVDPEVAYAKSAALLKPSGALTEFSHVQPAKMEGFAARVQDVYRACAPSLLSGVSPDPRAERKQPAGLELFCEPIVRCYPWSVRYSAEQYIQLLRTFSDHIRLPDAERNALFCGVADLIRQEYGGSVVRHSQAVLVLRQLRTE
jgi:ubiquinone/menaquinone biosynthesis C-methylase UbiE